MKNLTPNTANESTTALDGFPWTEVTQQAHLSLHNQLIKSPLLI